MSVDPAKCGMRNADGEMAAHEIHRGERMNAEEGGGRQNHGMTKSSEAGKARLSDKEPSGAPAGD